MAVVAITFDGVDVTETVIFRLATFESAVNGRAGPCRFRLRDLDGDASYVVGSRITLTIDGDPVWTGYCTAVKRVYAFKAISVAEFGATRFWDIEGSDLNILFTKRIVFDQADPGNTFGTLFPVGTPDTDAITDLLDNWLDLSGDDLDTTTGVTGVGNITVAQEGRAWSGGHMWGQAMTSIGSLPGAVFYLAPTRTLIYTDDETVTAPFGLSDTPDGVTYKGYREMEFLVDGTGLANDVLGWGIGYGSAAPIFQRIIDDDSVTEHGLWQIGKTYFGTFEQDTLDANINSIVYGSPLNLRGAKDDRHAVVLTTFHPGLLPAMKVDFRADVFSLNELLPIRKMVVTFPTPDTPRYELTLSTEIDTPFDIIDNLLFDLRLPPLPPIINPPPPPPVPIPCGITDTFDRPDDPTGLGIADCGRLWDVAPTDPMTIDDHHMYVPTGIEVGQSNRIASLPGPYPVPFIGRIIASAADIHPGFTYVTAPSMPDGALFGPVWEATGAGGAGYVDGSQLILQAGRVPSGIPGSVFAGTRGDRILNNMEDATTWTGHISVVETQVGNSGQGLDNYIQAGGAWFSIINAEFLYGGSPDVASLYVGHSSNQNWTDFPANFWRDTGEADFEVTYTGGVYGVGGTLVATVGPVSVSLVSTDYLVGSGLGFGNASNADGDPTPGPAEATWATMYVTDALVNGQAITDLNWEWQVDGALANLSGVSYRFGYVSMGGRIPFDIGYDGEPELWPYNAPTPAIWAWTSANVVGEILTVVPLGADSAWPFVPIVTISSISATLNIGGTTVSVTTASPVVSLNSALSHLVRNGQGEYATFNDLDVVGVNNCTEIAAPGQWVMYFFVGDGTTDTFTLFSTPVRGATAVYVDGVRLRLGADYTEDIGANAIVFVTPPAPDAVISVAYFPAPGSGTVEPAGGPAMYISPAGDDTTGDGTSGNPWATIGKFLSLPPAPGDTLYCRGGTYPTVAGNYNHYVTGVAGTSSNRITIMAYPGETPVFDGGCDGSLDDRHFIALRDGSSYWTIDGLQIVNYLQAGFGIITIGFNGMTTPTEHTILRNLHMEMAFSALAGNTEHAIYVQNYVDDTLIEDVYVKGPIGASAVTGAGVHVFHSPDATNTVTRRVHYDSWEQGFEMDGAAADGTIEWCTFTNNTVADMHFYDHAAWLIRNNVSDGSASVFYDEDGTGSETLTNNYPTETLNGDGTLQSGSAAINGATDGSDAGAYPF